MARGGSERMLTSPNEDTVFSLDQAANNIAIIAYITLSRLASEPRGRTPSAFGFCSVHHQHNISTHCNMTSSAKKFVLTASMLALAEAASVLRRKINERDLEALECTRRRWHFTVGETLQCSNDMDYPIAWDDESFVGHTIFSSISECCAAIEVNGRSCEVIDECADVEENMNTIKVSNYNDMHKCGQKWHVNLEKTWGCSNSKDFPDDWWLESNVKHMLHETPESCCSEIFGSTDCEVTDECATHTNNPCADPVWHYDYENHLCTNNGNYPLIWESEKERYLYQTQKECCERNANLFQGWHCNVHDFCSEWAEVGRD